MWNHNIHYEDWILDRIPKGRSIRALDIGCGAGSLTKRITEMVEESVAIDPCDEMTKLTKTKSPQTEVIQGDFLESAGELGTFDFVACSMSLHHMNEELALSAIAQLTNPGGAAAILGIAKSNTMRDHVLDSLGFVSSKSRRLFASFETQCAPQSPPRLSYQHIEQICEKRLGGCSFRRRLYFRFTVEWQRPFS